MPPVIAALPPFRGPLAEIGLAVLIFIVLLALGRWFKRRQGVRFGFAYVVFAACLAAYGPLRFVSSIPDSQAAWLKLLGALSVMSGAFVALALLRRYYWELWFERRRQVRVPKFLSDLVAVAVVLIAAMFVLTGIYGQNISWLLGASGVTAILLGLALQDTLGNIIAGISIEIGKPYRVGDWLIVDGKRVEVMEVNWRSTRCRDNDHVYYDIPNKHIVGTTVTNLTYPDRVHGIRIQVHFEYAAPPNEVKAVLQHAAGAAEGVLAQPAPRVFLRDFADSGIIYEVRFWIDDESRYNPICDAVRTNIWYEAQRHDLHIPFPIRIVRLEREKKETRAALEVARTSVRRQPFLQLLSPEQIDRLLAGARLLRFGRGERLIEQGAASESMFVLIRGEADVLVRVGSEEKRVAELREGDYFGEMGLLTGEPRAATVKARVDCEVWELSKEALGEILAENQPLVERLSELLAQRKMELDGLVEATMAEEEKKQTRARYQGNFLKRLYEFFEL